MDRLIDVSGVFERTLFAAPTEGIAEMVRMLSILFAGWVVNRVLAENRIRRPIALLPPPGRKLRKWP